MSKPRRARLTALASAPLYSGDTAMANYTKGKGYAITLYRPVAKAVTKETGPTISHPALAGKATYMNVNALVNFVINGTAADRASVVAGKQAQVAEVLRARALSHTAHVAQEYGKQLKKVPEENEKISGPGAQKIAKLHMTKIAAQVHDSLSTARKKTAALF
jgi:hypothetical protein